MIYLLKQSVLQHIFELFKIFEKMFFVGFGDPGIDVQFYSTMRVFVVPLVVGGVHPNKVTLYSNLGPWVVLPCIIYIV